MKRENVSAMHCGDMRPPKSGAERCGEALRQQPVRVHERDAPARHAGENRPPLRGDQERYAREVSTIPSKLDERASVVTDGFQGLRPEVAEAAHRHAVQDFIVQRSGSVGSEHVQVPAECTQVLRKVMDEGRRRIFPPSRVA